MRIKRDPETAEERREREEQHIRERRARDLAETAELDAAVKRSIKLHGA